MLDNEDARRAVEDYQRIVLEYEMLDAEIDQLLGEYQGKHDLMPPDALTRYRELARQRDDAYNTMRFMEQQLLDIDDTLK
jgi:hypothetical protein